MEVPSKTMLRHRSADDLAAVLDMLGIPVLELNDKWYSPAQIQGYAIRVEKKLGLKL